MIRILALLLAIVTGIASYYSMRKSTALLPLLKKEAATESQQFTERFGRYYLVTTILGVLAAIFSHPLSSIGFIFSVLLFSTSFSLAFTKKMS